MTQFTIKDLSDFSGIKQHTIRIWEQRFNFLKPGRGENLRRRYTTEELNTFLEVSLLNQSGYKVSRIARMSDAEKKNVVSGVHHLQQLKTVNELIICMADMDTDRFEMVLDNAVLCWGIHETIQQVLIPFCDRVGMLQKPDPKNYIENILLIRSSVLQKIHSGIEKAAPTATRNKSIMLFLPPGEQHELCMLYLHYMLRMEGYTSVYLGRQITAEHLEQICMYKKPDFLITQFFEKSPKTNLDSFINGMPVNNPGTKLVSLGSTTALQPNGLFTCVPEIEGVLNEIRSSGMN